MGPPSLPSRLAPPLLLSSSGSTLSASQLRPIPQAMFNFSLSVSLLALVPPPPGMAPPLRAASPATCLSHASAVRPHPSLKAPAPRSACFPPPGRPLRPPRLQRCSELEVMGLPEERGRSGGGSGVREEAGARSRLLSWSPPPEVSRSAHVPSLQRYRELHRRSLEEPRGEAGPGRA